MRRGTAERFDRLLDTLQMVVIGHSRAHRRRGTREKERSARSMANYEGSVRLPCAVRADAAGADVYLRTRAMGAQDGSASPIYSTRETGTLLPVGRE